MNTGIVKRMLCLALALCAGLVMSGCTGRSGEEKAPSPTLAPAVVELKAPDGDRSVRKAGDYTIYLPGPNELQLRTQTVHLEETNLKDTAETLVRLLLDSNNAAQGQSLALYHSEPPEISGGICTVNLDPSALWMDYSNYYKLSVALATTLCALDEISGVNVLTANQSVALDVTGSLPMGTLSGHPGENLPVLWEQMAAKRTPLGTDSSQTPLSAAVTVYYPLKDGRGIGCESRMMNFPGQKPDQLAAVLVDAVNEAVHRKDGNAGLPNLADYMLHVPVTSVLDDGGKLITVSFRENIRDLAEEWNTDRSCLIAAVVCTLSTFVPGVTAVCVRVGDTLMTEMDSTRYSVGTILGGLIRRETAEMFLTGSANVFFEKNGRLAMCEKPVERDMTDSPRAVLEAILEGPDRREREAGILPTIPETVSGDDILGIAAEDDMLLVNLSETFRKAIEAAGPEKEALLCYSIVNSLCLNSGMKRVCFFFEGKQAETIAGGLYWGGVFMYNPGM